MENQLVNLTIVFPSLTKTAVICCSTKAHNSRTGALTPGKQLKEEKKLL